MAWSHEQNLEYPVKAVVESLRIFFHRLGIGKDWHWTSHEIVHYKTKYRRLVRMRDRLAKS
jgi:hypothetical protein